MLQIFCVKRLLGDRIICSPQVLSNQFRSSPTRFLVSYPGLAKYFILHPFPKIGISDLQACNTLFPDSSTPYRYRCAKVGHRSVVLVRSKGVDVNYFLACGNDRSEYEETVCGGTGPKFCRFHKRGLLSSPPVEPTKLMPSTSVVVSEVEPETR